MNRLVATFAFIFALSGCAIHQTVKPVTAVDIREICLIENAEVRSGFLRQVTTSLTQKGYQVRMLSASASLQTCPVTATYVGNWRWDLALYLAYAEIKVYHEGRPAGEAVYDAMQGGANMSKFINAEEKIHEMVDQLFPGRARS